MLSGIPDSDHGCAGIVGSLNPSSGGEFQYSLAVIRALDRLGGRNFTVFTRPHEQSFIEELMLSNRFRMVPLDPPGGARLLGRVKSLARRMPWAERIQEWRRHNVEILAIRTRPAAAAHFRAHDLRWIFYTAPNVLSFEAGVPFIMPIHDMQHRLQPHFPEVSADGEWQRREYLFGNAARHARMILVDSDIGKEDVLEAYRGLGLTEDRVGVLPFLPPDYLRQPVTPRERNAVRQRYQLPQRYLFYPAQFWPHKNHLRLVEAIKEVVARHPDLHLVLAGSTTGSLRAATFATVRQMADQLGIAARIRSLGYVPNADMGALYAESVSLVFPTFFGPTNIPIIEAWALGVPVVTSRIRGVTEQVGDAGLLADPKDVQDIARAIERIWTDDALRKSLAERGREKLARYDVPQFDSQLADILDRLERA